MSNSLRPHGLQHARLPCPEDRYSARNSHIPPSDKRASRDESLPLPDTPSLITAQGAEEIEGI